MACGTCNEQCWKFKSEFPWFGKADTKARAYCSICQFATDWKGKTCPCCNTNLRFKRRNKPRNKRLEVTTRIT